MIGYRTAPGDDALDSAPRVQFLDDPSACPVCRVEGCEDAEHIAKARTQRRHAKLVETFADRERARRDARRRVDVEERGALVLPEPLTLRDRLARPEPETRWRIHGWQPVETRVLLAAQFKAGKTVKVGNVLRSLVDGDPFMGVATVEPITTGTVVLLDTEMPEALLDRWLRAQQIRAAHRIIPVNLRGRVATLDLIDPTARTEWARWLRGVQARYVVLDCLRPVLDAFGLDEHRDVGRFLVPFDALLADAGVPEALVVHHMGHTNERSRGDSRLRDWPDVEWRLVRRTDDPASPRYLTAYGRDVDQPEQALAYDSVGRRLTIAGGSRQDAATATALAAVVAVLDRAETDLSQSAIQRALDGCAFTRAQIHAALQSGVATKALSERPGPRRSRLFRVCRHTGETQ